MVSDFRYVIFKKVEQTHNPVTGVIEDTNVESKIWAEVKPASFGRYSDFKRNGFNLAHTLVVRTNSFDPQMTLATFDNEEYNIIGQSPGQLGQYTLVDIGGSI